MWAGSEVAHCDVTVVACGKVVGPVLAEAMSVCLVRDVLTDSEVVTCCYEVEAR